MLRCACCVLLVGCCWLCGMLVKAFCSLFNVRRAACVVARCIAFVVCCDLLVMWSLLRVEFW